MKVKIIFTFIYIALVVSCKSYSQPIVIDNLPINNVREDMTLEEYISESTRYAIELKAYTNELINQILHRAVFIDLRKKK